MYEAMIGRMRQRAAWLFLDAVAINQDVVLQYRKRAESCIKAVNMSNDEEKTKRAMTAWLFWME